MNAACFICGATETAGGAPGYRRCVGCGHETLAAGEAQVLMVNDDLTGTPSARPSRLERFQGAVLARFTAGRPSGRLLDIGAGAGLFLHRQRGRCARLLGIEISPPSVDYARRVLGLEIVDGIAAVDGPVDVATAWHSLEHMPAAVLTDLLAGLRAKLAPGGCVIVSVPNAASWQCRGLGSRYAFHDRPAHLHQFTPDSLGRLFAAHGFVRTGAAVSWPYNVFGWAQGLLNLVMPGHNYVYCRLKRGHPRASLARDLAGLLLSPPAVLPALPLALLEALRPDRQAVLTWRFELRP